jgi:hypothetical protein
MCLGFSAGVVWPLMQENRGHRHGLIVTQLCFERSFQALHLCVVCVLGLLPLLLTL